MAQQRPPTPELQYDLHHVAQHNANQAYRDIGYTYADSPYTNPRYQVAYGSQIATMQDIRAQHGTDPYLTQQYPTSQYPEIHSPGDNPFNVQYDGYGPSPLMYHGDDTYNYNGESYMHQNLPDNSPPTPKSTHSDDARRTRSGRNPVARTISPKRDASRRRVTKSPKPKKLKAGKGDKQTTPKLTAPLSILTKDMKVPVRDMEAWVTRSAETRQKEVENRNGQVPRPMNSFMLYRSAYAERTKEWCSKNNHQVVSSVSGESWPLEPPAVQESYKEYSRIERINHQKAFPTYKFSPSKATNAGRKKRSESPDDNEEYTSNDCDDPDQDWIPSNRRSKAKQGKKQSTSPYNTAGANLHQEALRRSLTPNRGLQRSCWEATNAGKPLPAAMGTSDLYRQYYQTTVHPHQRPGIEDVRMVKTGAPGVRYGTHESLTGLPSGFNHELLPVNPYLTPPARHEPQVDPILLAYGTNGADQHFADQQFPDAQQTDFLQEYQYNTAYGYPADHNGLHTYMGATTTADYHPDLYGGPLDAGSEIDHWL